MADVICGYCSKPAVLVSGAVIYPHRPDLSHRNFYQCAPCDAYVGCHAATTTALGTPANAELRLARRAAHLAFDSTWQNGMASRTAMYAWLAKQLGIEQEQCHIAMFDIETCRRVIQVLRGG